jgi:hypothetical protein
MFNFNGIVVRNFTWISCTGRSVLPEGCAHAGCTPVASVLRYRLDWAERDVRLCVQVSPLPYFHTR